MFSKKPIMELEESKNFIIKLGIITIFLVALFFFYQIANIVVILIFALFLNILFAPFLNKLNKWKIADWLGIMLIYLTIFAFILVVFFTIVPIFIKQTGILIDNIINWINTIKAVYELKGVDGFGLPKFMLGLISHIDFNSLFDSIKNNISEISKFVGNNFKNFLTNGAGFIFSITSAFINFILVFIFTFFIALERKQIRSFFYKIIPENISKFIFSKEDKIVDSLYNWLKGQMILGASIFTITIVGLLFLRVFGIKIEEYFTLALIAGMMEFVPYIGPFIALLPALAIAAGLGIKSVIIITILYIIIQQVENNVLVPLVMSKSLSLSPFSVLIAMTIGASLFGIIGIIVAIPIVSIIQIFLLPYLEKKKNIK
ncbi:MAG: AI-2E family transporter [Candidatus Gracilibacteria bacterium]|nr:AI-2E family transporter [Candidatus Gracilibacteria bacterium]MDD2908861.1 AI-2E family transporter [Candidatus Gracilibacteria bacterium]